MPQVAVLMTVYNGGEYLRSAVESILNQTFSEFEFIIVNDGSVDDSATYLDSINDARVKVIHQENKGTAAAANLGLSHIRAPFVARMDADDIALPKRLEKQLAFMRSHPNIGIVGAQIAHVGRNGVGSSLNLPTQHAAIFKSMLNGQHGIAHSVIMIRTSILKSIGGYWQHRLIDDWDMMLRMGEISQLANLDEVLLHYRVHGASLNGSSQLELHQNYAFAIHCAKRRQANMPELNYEQFQAMRDSRPFISRFIERTNIFAMTQYHKAIAEIYDSNRWVGYCRLLFAAACFPMRTVHRLGRMTPIQQIFPKRMASPGKPVQSSSYSN